MSDELAVLFEQYQGNVFPGMARVYGEKLGVSVKSTQRVGLGYDPARGTWVTPERDEKGQIIGLSHRTSTGKKFSATGGHRGLVYVFNALSQSDKKAYVPGAHNWVRLSPSTPDIVCPKCGKTDWCLVSADNICDPQACICQRISDGSERPIGDGGWLHILKTRGNVKQALSVLEDQAGLPVLVVEGASDVLAATDLGFVAVGKPSAEGGQQLLKKVLQGLDVCVIGENDEHVDSLGKQIWPGKQGLESSMQNLIGVARSVVGIYPPPGIKDLRAWFQTGLTHKELQVYIEEKGSRVAGDADVLPDDNASNIAALYLDKNYRHNGVPLIRNYRGVWIVWKDGRYKELPMESFYGTIYNFLDSKRYKSVGTTGELSVKSYKPTRSRVRDIVDAMSRWCPIDSDAPAWLNGVDGPDPRNLVMFTNGILDINEYVKGKIVLYDPTPDLFTFTALPYVFDEDAESKLWNDTLDDMASGEKDKLTQWAQWGGYNIVHDISMEALMLFQGRPRSGKGTFINTMCAMLGQDQVAATSFSSLCGSFGYQPLVGKLAAILGDAKVPHYGDASMALEKMLQISGGDRVDVNRKNLPIMPNVQLTCRFTIAVNNLPALTDHAKALESRLQVSWFGESYLGREDRTLKSRLAKEAQEGKIINWALRGLADLRKSGRFIIPKTSYSILNAFRALITPVSAFIADCCDLAPDDLDTTEAKFNKGYWISKDEVYDAWKAWCEDQGRKPGVKEFFGQDLVSMTPSIEGGRRMNGEERVYIYTGIRLKPWVHIQFLGKPGGKK